MEQLKLQLLRLIVACVVVGGASCAGMLAIMFFAWDWTVMFDDTAQMFARMIGLCTFLILLAERRLRR